MSYLPNNVCSLDPVAAVAVISDEANCSWLYQSHSGRDSLKPSDAYIYVSKLAIIGSDNANDG